MAREKTTKAKAKAKANEADQKKVDQQEPVAGNQSVDEKKDDAGASDQNGLKDTGHEGSDQNGLNDAGSCNSDQNGLGETKKKIAVIIPYLKGKAQGLELLYAVRSIAKNFTEDDYQLVVIGDKEDWFSDEILFIDKPCIGSNPQADVIDKIKTILVDESIPEEFVWTNDDIYFVSPTTMSDLRILKTDGLLKTDGSARTYNKNRERTIKALLRLGRPIRNFATHMPVVYEKEKMMSVFETFSHEMEAGLLLSSAYFNLHFDAQVRAEKCNWFKDSWSLRVISDLRSEDKKQLFRDLIVKKHFLNHSEEGFSKLLMDWLARQFSTTCKFEK